MRSFDFPSVIQEIRSQNTVKKDVQVSDWETQPKFEYLLLTETNFPENAVRHTNTVAYRSQ